MRFVDICVDRSTCVSSKFSQFAPISRARIKLFICACCLGCRANYCHNRAQVCVILLWKSPCRQRHSYPHAPQFESQSNCPWTERRPNACWTFLEFWAMALHDSNLGNKLGQHCFHAKYRGYAKRFSVLFNKTRKKKFGGFPRILRNANLDLIFYW